VAVFTSGGVIGVTVQNVLNAPEPLALEINWRVRNCSMTEFIFSRDRLSLDSFNTIPHLDDPALRTYR
jgi:broad specificity phosphatase PhoE